MNHSTAEPAPARPDGGSDRPWVHRIDAVPDVGRTVEVRTTAEREHVATTERNPRTDGYGIGAEVVYRLTDGRAFDAQQIAWWRYVHDAPEACDVCNAPGPNPCDACLPGCVETGAWWPA